MKKKKVEVTVCVSLSKNVVIEIPEGKHDYETLENAVLEQIMLPQDYLEAEEDIWDIDEMVIVP